MATKPEIKTEENAVQKMIDKLVANAQKALDEYMKMDQEQVDKIVHAMAIAGLRQPHDAGQAGRMRKPAAAFMRTKSSKTCSPPNISGIPSNIRKDRGRHR